MTIKRCGNCRYGDNIGKNADSGIPIIKCRLFPPAFIIHEGSTIGCDVPPMTPQGYCGQFKLSLSKLFRGQRA